MRQEAQTRQEGRAGTEHEGPHTRQHQRALLWSHTGPSPGYHANRSPSRAVSKGRSVLTDVEQGVDLKADEVEAAGRV